MKERTGKKRDKGNANNGEKTSNKENEPERWAEGKGEEIRKRVHEHEKQIGDME